MIDRALGFTAPESYYFQLYPVNLVLLQEPVPSSESKYKFSIYKGMQKFDENKIATEANFINTNGTHVMPFRGCQLNFYLPNFNKNRKITFTLKLSEKDATEQYDIGGVDIDPATYISKFKDEGVNRFEQKIDISEQYAIEFEVYLEKSRFALQKIVKSYQPERTMKSPLRERKSPVRERSPPVSQQKSPSEEKFQTSEKSQPVVEKSASKSRSSVVGKPVPKQQQAEIVQQVVETPREEPVVYKPVQKSRQTKKELEVKIQNAKSQKSQTIVSPVVKTKQMKRTSGRNETTIRASQRLIKQEPQQVVTKAQDADTWTNHLQLVAFTVIGILLIYWVMHPNSKV